ncbi:XRE family transcriptional regulator [Streptomyces sp. OfavH-34-F]|uniref:XRE family transcriptional regulator n=1 Tax=Streptomyces sp. OfavH-34-F TaxID=2917760 RepID=UPI001EF2E52B|nr:XRE family transcriptional regulator [Streptomyces sp. OfavH-34-F]MCG7526736.1 XRE family transcriptional regulator [Streptomyces sp. OfavH-34-F]
MAAIKQRINPDVLVWAMKQAGTSRTQLAGDLGTDPTTVDSWMTGDETPGLTQLRQIAKTLRRPTSLFFSPHVPAQRPLRASFRKPFGSHGVRTLTSEERAEIRLAERRQKIANWAAERVEEHHPATLPTRQGTPEATAKSVQTWLHWNVSDQVKATSKLAVTKMVRRSLEDQGIMVLQLSLNSDACRGFSLYSETVPLIAYNSSQVAAARTFTMLHELGHLISHEQAVCDQPEDSEERWCDRFAAAFLLPEEHLRAYIAKYLKITRVENDDIESVRRISNRYGASFQCVALRLIHLGIASQPLYRVVSSGSFEVDAPGFGGELQTTHLVRMREYGVTYPRLLLAARERGKLHDIDARKYLNVNGEQLRNLQQRIAEEV